MAAKSRKASHAGSWYSSNSATLTQQLNDWMHDVEQSSAASAAASNTRGVIAPHAGYSYSGPSAAYSYAALQRAAAVVDASGARVLKRVFILGPSHHHHSTRCELTSFSSYSTPQSLLTVDVAVVKQLHSSGLFDVMRVSVDEAEHSIELQLPFISHVMAQTDAAISAVTATTAAPFTIVPILVGSLSPSSERLYGKLLSPYFHDAANFFIISSDFCHWGQRFQYTFRHISNTNSSSSSSSGNSNSSKKQKQNQPQYVHRHIHESIRANDEAAMAAITRAAELRDPSQFTDYLKQTNNTICGRHPIAVMLNMIAAEPAIAVASSSASAATVTAAATHNIIFLCYTQSSQCTSIEDSSVSYAAAVISTTSATTSLNITNYNKLPAPAVPATQQRNSCSNDSSDDD